MQEEIIETTQEEDSSVQKYIDTITELKRTSVSRAEYDKVCDENRKLLTSIVNGTAMENSSTESPATPTIDELRNQAYGKDCDVLTDLEYVKTVLNLRDAVMEATGHDPFIPDGKKYTATLEDQVAAQRTYDGLAHCVDIADGDNSVFLREFARITNDTQILRRKR